MHGIAIATSHVANIFGRAESFKESFSKTRENIIANVHKKFTTDIRAIYSLRNYHEHEEVGTKMPSSVHGRQSHVCTFDTIRVTGNIRFVDGTIKRTCTQQLFAVFHSQPHEPSHEPWHLVIKKMDSPLEVSVDCGMAIRFFKHQWLIHST